MSAIIRTFHDVANIFELLLHIIIAKASIFAIHMDKPCNTDYIRVVVSRCDDSYIHCHTDDDTPLRVSYASPDGDATCWAYLKPLLHDGSQLNIICPTLKTDEGEVPTATAELIILEPDYLVDISAIAACFESYSRSPLLHTLHRLQPSQSSSAIVLGNLASQFLDEELCLPEEQNTYEHSIRQFFREHTMPLVTTTLSPDFHKAAKQQKLNIRRAIRQSLPSLAGAFQPEATMVEPSFFSEMLGIQGRMDFLQLDMRVLIEQKSGKGGFLQPTPDTPAYQLKHYIQLLLYMLLIRYNYRSQYEQNGGELHAFLLYSKYANGLLRAGFDVKLIHDAIRLRNGIVATEYDFSHLALQPLSLLTADMMNTLQSHGQLWERYQRPQLEAMLAPLHAASPLERAYYLRMLAFVQAEHLLAKVGHTASEGHASFADKWYSSLDEKLSMGNIYHKLELIHPAPEAQGKVERVVLRRHDNMADDVSNFRPGDIVILYAYPDGCEPDARTTMVFRCTLADIGTHEITLLIRATQTDTRVLHSQHGNLWAIEHDFFESSFSSLYRGLHALLAAPRERRDLLLMQRRPMYDATLCLRGDYGAMNDLALRVRQALDLFLIIGPPGTGKTSFGMLTTLQEELLTPGSHVLIMAYTNRAVDELCSKLVENGIDFLRLGSSLTCDEPYRPYLLSTVAAQHSQLDSLRTAISAARVVVGTTTALSANPAFFTLQSFSLAIIDEASQLLEPHLAGVLSAVGKDGRPAIRKIVLIGDHKQLPAVVQQPAAQSVVADTALHGIGLTDCRLSLFERMLRAYRDDPHVCCQLTHQGRMHPAIADFPNHEFYGGMLSPVPLPHQQEADSLGGCYPDRMTFIDVEPLPDDIGTKVNSAEAQLVADIVVDLYREHPAAFNTDNSIGVIVPYRNQIAAVRSALQRSGIELLSRITIDTVERYQGSQRDTIIYSCTVSTPAQLSFLTESAFTDGNLRIDRKLNVAMTRARQRLIICGNATLLRHDPTYARLIDYTKS